MVISALFSWFGILLLWVGWVWLWRGYSVDRFRYDLFVARDRLFDLADRGGLEFDHPAYGMLRLTMNGFLRYADQVCLTQIVLAVCMKQPESALGFRRRFQEAKKRLTPEARAEIEGIHRRVIHAVWFQVVRRNPFVLALMLPVLLFSSGQSSKRDVLVNHPGLDGVEARAERLGAALAA